MARLTPNRCIYIDITVCFMLDHIHAVHNSRRFSRLLASYDDRWTL